jgi:hypothetical protein
MIGPSGERAFEKFAPAPTCVSCHHLQAKHTEPGPSSPCCKLGGESSIGRARPRKDIRRRSTHPMLDHLRQAVRAPSGVLFITLAVCTQRALRLAYVWRLTVGCTLGLMSTTVPAWTILDRTWFVLLRHQHLFAPQSLPPGAQLAATTRCLSR